MAATGSRGAAGRIAVAQHQARITLGLAGGFALAAVVTLALPHHTGWWLPLHLFLVGSVLLAISGTTQLFAVSWAAGPPPTARVAGVQRGLVAVGAALLAAGRELEWTAVVAVGGTLVVLSLVVLGASLRATVTAGVQRRFDASLHAYLVALAAGLGGCALGISMGVDAGGSLYPRLRSAHLALNLLGLVGIVIVGTLPLFTATQARVKASPRATAPAQARLLVGFAAALALAVVGLLAEWHVVAALGLAGYATGLVALVGLLPAVGRKQLRWAGPRLVQLGAGVAWWTGATLVAAEHAARGGTVFTPAVLGALVVGGFAQILAAAVAYLGPVLRGGGHARLSAGFRTTRAWPGLVLANAAAVALALGAPTVAGVAIALWMADAATRTAVLVRPAPHHG